MDAARHNAHKVGGWSREEVGRENSRLTERYWRLISAEMSLPKRQQEVVRLVVDGFDNSTIAETLGVRPDTVHAHLSRVYKKLGVRNRCELAVQVLLVLVRALERRCASEQFDESDREPMGELLRK